MNYASIVAAALAYADRADDTEVVANQDVFLRAVENRINTRLKVREMSGRTQLLTRDGVEYYGLPSDFAGIRDIELASAANSRNRYTLQYLNPEQMNNWSTNTSADTAGTQTVFFYTILADQFHIMNPTSGMLLELVYYRKVPELLPASPDDENWISTGYPNLYIFGMLVEISSFAKDKESAVLWDQRFTEEVMAIDNDDRISRWSGTSLQVRTDG
jgi:hypothetical protein